MWFAGFAGGEEQRMGKDGAGLSGLEERGRSVWE